ncbi:hypothetical protein Aab01nite_78620 [Paractinoplanes abujensis]|uniref:FtsX extracellular domain-containing protein n=1 Tax=Paractinoplanes abujensis TaxID=882441 RepID=A0A7W7CPA7_9ACTN|nr:permease-like cell division protein FtsX [Actinoplanes abujensis]MBB4692248.1 hypothetical protein [Actinoplanes abujensis]GID24272.1 hypothetical protein Aab01nite_78620 [Actinoplanes abujensis]
MNAHLREQFDQAVSADPGADAGVMASAAIAEGGRVRRRRHRLTAAGVAAGVVLAVGVGVGVNLRSEAPPPPLTIPAAMMPLAAPGCSVGAVQSGATDVAMFLTHEATEQQRAAIRSALDGDARVESFYFESRQTAYERFKQLWKDSPDFVASVGPESLPESFRVRLADPAPSTAFEQQYAAMAGVQDIVGRTCPESAPVGGVK